MNELEFTFLTEKQIFGNDQLDILKKYGIRCAITDFAILLGADVSPCPYINEWNSRKEYTGSWWTKNLFGFGARAVSNGGINTSHGLLARLTGARPAFPYSLISEISTNAVSGAKEIIEVEYGEYPQDIVSEKLSKRLEDMYTAKTIKTTGKEYTTDSVNYKDFYTPFKARMHIEYEYKGKKYIRFVAESNNWWTGILSNGRKVEVGKPYWVEVKPITWMIDEKADIALSKYIIFSGVPFEIEIGYKGDFENTDIYRFLNEVFAKDIIPSIINPSRKQSWISRLFGWKSKPFSPQLSNEEANTIEVAKEGHEELGNPAVSYSDKVGQPEILVDIMEKILSLDLEKQNEFFRKLRDILKFCETDSNLVVERILELQTEVAAASQSIDETKGKIK